MFKYLACASVGAISMGAAIAVGTLPTERTEDLCNRVGPAYTKCAKNSSGASLPTTFDPKHRREMTDLVKRHTVVAKTVYSAGIVPRR